MILSLLKARLAATLSGIGRNSRKKTSNKRGIGFKILMGILAVYVVICFFLLFGIIFGNIAPAFHEIGFDWLYYSVAGILSFALCFIGSIFMAQHQIFEARDNELLLSMPIKPSAILLSRVLAIYIVDLAYTLFVMLPALAVRWLTFGAAFTEVIFAVLETLLIPILSMAFSCVFGWLIAMISARMRNKNAITLVVSLAFFGGYFYVCAKMQDYITLLAQSGATIAETIRKAVFPAYHMGIAAAEGDVASFFIFLACAVIPFAIVFFAISRNFAAIVSTKVGAPKVKYVEKRLRVKNSGKALVLKEIKRFTGSAMYVLNGGLGTIFLLVVSVLLVVKQDVILSIASAYGMSGISTSAIICMGLCICASMNFISASAISLEAKTMWLVKSLPVDTGSLLMSKAFCHFIFSAAGTVIASSVACVVLNPTAAEIIAMFILPIAFSAFTALAGLLINLHFPKFDWINEVTCIKQSASVIVTMLVNIAAAVLPIILYFLVLSKSMGSTAFLFTEAALFAVVTAVLTVRLKTAGVKIFNEL